MMVRTFVVAALLGVAMPAAVLAQANSPSESSAAGLNADVKAGAGAMNADTSFDALLEQLETADYTSATPDLAAAAAFDVVRISDMTGADATRLQDVIAPHEQDIAQLPDWINSNAAAKAALDAEGLSPNDVVWIASDPEGGVTLFVNDFDASGAMGAGAMSKSE